MSKKIDVNETLERLKKHPNILESVKELLDLAEGVKGIEKADNVDYELITEVRGLGKKVLQNWAEGQTTEKEKKAARDGLRQHSKKN